MVRDDHASAGTCVVDQLAGRVRLQRWVDVHDHAPVFAQVSGQPLLRERVYRLDLRLALQESKPELKRPPLFKVVLINDDYTPMEFVVDVLETVFHKSHAEAVRIMLHVHQKGVGVCGVFTYEIAETKAAIVRQQARKEGFPMRCSVEER